LHEEWARPEEVKESGKAANPRGEARKVVVDRSGREEIARRRSAETAKNNVTRPWLKLGKS
jgi:hypothetical protein